MKPHTIAAMVIGTSTAEPFRLTELAHGGGCGCKVAPGLLARILQHSPGLPIPAALLVGIETSDDAAVYQLNAQQALIATTDFFTPVVDDAFDFGRIAATNAISDVYAMGGTPIFALAIVGMPIDRLPVETIAQVLAGGQAVCQAAGIPIAGGHTIDSQEPIYGLVVMGLAAPDRILRNSTARAGDVLVLGKPIGVGVLSAALKKNQLSPSSYAAMLHSTTQLNTPGPALAALPGVHALTDVTGFGLLGHLLEMCRPSGLSARLDHRAVPLLANTLELALAGHLTGASRRNALAYGDEISWHSGIAPIWHSLLTDPQTSGGLLVACDAHALEDVMQIFRSQGFAHATRIGELAPRAASARLITVH